jgi:hypothetical protein
LKANTEDGPTGRNIFNFIAAALGTVWLALTPRWPYLLLGPGALYLQSMPMKLTLEWVEFYWAILAVVCGHLALQFLGLFRLLPRRTAKAWELALKIIGLGIGVLLLLKFPNYVTSPDQAVADWANWSFLICVIVWFAVNLIGTARMLISLIRERHQMLPAGQH